MSWIALEYCVQFSAHLDASFIIGLFRAIDIVAREENESVIGN